MTTVEGEVQQSAVSGPALTLEAAAARYLSSRRTIGLKPGTISDYECHLRVHLLPAFGHRQLAEIRADDVDAFIAAQREGGQATNSVLRQIGLLGAIFNYEIKRGRCERNLTPPKRQTRAASLARACGMVCESGTAVSRS